VLKARDEAHALSGGEAEESFTDRLQTFMSLTEQLDTDIRSMIKMVGIVILVTGICLVVLKPVSEIIYQVGMCIWFLGIATFTTMDTCLNLFAADHCLFFQAMLVQMFSYTVLYAYNGKPGMLVALLFLLYVLVCQRWIRYNAEVEGSCWPRFTTMMTTWSVLYLSVGFGANDLYLL